MPLSAEDMLILDSMKRSGVLQNIEGHRLDEREGIILVPCSDGDHILDTVNHHSMQVTMTHREEPRPHTLALNGGALNLPKHSPLCQELREDLVLMKHIEKARKMKNIHVIALYAHRPCGAAQEAGFTFEQQISLLMDAKQRLKRELSQEPQLPRVATFFHLAPVDPRTNKLRRRTYFVSFEKWNRWKSSHDVLAHTSPT